jgi:UDP-3-O-[3-hydroxymyristoyl] N-acetylglucosamine deacetylase
LNRYQHTLRKPFQIEGIGLHTGKTIKMRALPAPANTGIRFLRTDIMPHTIIPARLDFVVDTSLSTVIGINNLRIHTIEHLMAAFSGMNVDNAIVELSGPEAPICDGSSDFFVQSIRETGIKEQNSLRHYIEIIESFSFVHGDKRIEVKPAGGFEVFCEISYNHPLITYQNFNFSLSEGNFFDIYNARTFGFLSDVEKLKAMGLIMGGSLDNAIVLDTEGVINPEGLRHHDEFARHKTLDIVGDMFLLGYPVLGKVSAYKSGHQLHYQFAKALYSNNKLWKLTTMESEYETIRSDFEFPAVSYN